MRLSRKSWTSRDKYRAKSAKYISPWMRAARIRVPQPGEDVAACVVHCGAMTSGPWPLRGQCVEVAATVCAVRGPASV
ncbi:hypothetical protein J6590_058239 [Homalodisca vitripennis]|nr:hypothetical protein J6590_058239 [Homalodisca vitripennis]